MIDGVKIELKSEFSQDTKVSFTKEGQSIDLTEDGLIWWPIEIRIDEKGASATLRMSVKELEIDGVKVKIEEPDK